MSKIKQFKTVNEQTLELADQHAKDLASIFADYLVHESVTLYTEALTGLSREFRECLESLDEEITFKKAVEYLKKAVIDDSHNVDFSEVLECATDADNNEIIEHVARLGYVMIEEKGIDNLSKIEYFLRAEVYPFDKDFDTHVTL